MPILSLIICSIWSLLPVAYAHTWIISTKLSITELLCHTYLSYPIRELINISKSVCHWGSQIMIALDHRPFHSLFFAPTALKPSLCKCLITHSFRFSLAILISFSSMDRKASRCSMDSIGKFNCKSQLQGEMALVSCKNMMVWCQKVMIWRLYAM